MLLEGEHSTLQRFPRRLPSQPVRPRRPAVLISSLTEASAL